MSSEMVFTLATTPGDVTVAKRGFWADPTGAQSLRHWLGGSGVNMRTYEYQGVCYVEFGGLGLQTVTPTTLVAGSTQYPVTNWHPSDQDFTLPADTTFQGVDELKLVVE